MGKRTTRDLDFKIGAIISGTEIHSMINGVEYVHLVDSALVPKLESLYLHSPGKALQFLKTKARDYWRVEECSRSGNAGKKTQL